MKRTCLLFGVIWGITVSAGAQTAPITAYEAQVFISATNTTVTRAIPLTAVTCNLAPIPAPATPPVNPTTIQFDDPAVVGRDCRASVGNFLSSPSLPAGTGYNVTMTALYLDSTGVSAATPKSALSNPFTVAVVVVPPFAPTSVGVRP